MRRRLSAVVLASLIAALVPVAPTVALADGVTVEVRSGAIQPGDDVEFDLSGCPPGDHLAVDLGWISLTGLTVTAGDQPWTVLAAVPATAPAGGGEAPINPGGYWLQVVCGDMEETTAFGGAMVQIAPPAAVPAGAGVSSVAAAPDTGLAGDTIELPLPGDDHFGSDRVPLVYLYDDDGPRQLELIGPAPSDGATYPVKVELPAQISGSHVSLVAFGETWNSVPASPIAVASLTIVASQPPKPTDPEKTARDHLDDIIALLKEGKPITELPKVDGKRFGSLKDVLGALGVKITKMEGKELKDGLDAKQKDKHAEELAKKKEQQKDATKAAKQKRGTAIQELLKELEAQKKLEEEFAKKQQLLTEQERRLEEQRQQAEELKRRLEEQKRAQEEAQRKLAEEQAKIALELRQKLEEQKRLQELQKGSTAPGAAAPPLVAPKGASVADHLVGIATPLGISLGPWGPLNTLPFTNGPLDNVVPEELELEDQVLQIMISQGLLFPKLTTPIALPGFEPNQAVVLAVESTLTPLAEGVADGDGVVRMDVDLPDGIEAGSHTLYAVAGDQATIADVQVASIDDVVDAVLSVVDVLAEPADAERVPAEPELPETGRGVLVLFTLALAALLAGVGLLRPRRQARVTVGLRNCASQRHEDS